MTSWMDRAQRTAEVLRRGRVLVVSGSDEHAGAIAHALTELDLIPVLAFDADSARRTADGVSCNIAVLDVRVVEGSPLPLIRELAELVGAGVLVLGTSDEPADRLFDAGAFLLGSSDWSGLHVAGACLEPAAGAPAGGDPSDARVGTTRARPRDAPRVVGRQSARGHADRVQDPGRPDAREGRGRLEV